jgi:hypothetical protein
MLSRMPSVKDTYFQHKLLTRIHGKPTYESLQNGLTELKANASSVPSTLGGGHHGHLGLLLSEARYTALANTAPSSPLVIQVPLPLLQLALAHKLKLLKTSGNSFNKRLCSVKLLKRHS